MKLIHIEKITSLKYTQDYETKIWGWDYAKEYRLTYDNGDIVHKQLLPDFSEIDELDKMKKENLTRK